jgi:hypothetical protein
MDPATLVKANFSVDGGDLYINTVEAKNNNTEANITLYSELEAGDVTVKPSTDVTDEAKFGVISETLTATVVEDEDAPVVVGFKDATTTGVTLIFNEEIEIKDDAVANYYHTNGTNTVEDAIVAGDLSSDGKELTLDFTTNTLPEGTAYVYILAKAVNDLWDNTNAQVMFQVEVTLDETAPEASSVKVKTESQVEVTFSEEVVKADAEKVANYKVLQDGEEVENVIDDIAYAAKKATIDFTKNLSGDYVLVIENVEDPSENVMADTTLDFTVDDLTAPVHTDFAATIYKAGATGQMIRVTFGEAMNTEGNYSVVDAANYTIGGTALSTYVSKYSATVTIADGGKAVEIKIPHDVDSDGKKGVDLTDGDDIVLARVADEAGNYTAAFTGNIDVVAAANVNISKVEVTGTKTVVVTFDDLLADFDADDLQIQENDNTVLALAKRAISTDSKGNTVVTIT